MCENNHVIVNVPEAIWEDMELFRKDLRRFHKGDKKRIENWRNDQEADKKPEDETKNLSKRFRFHVS